MRPHTTPAKFAMLALLAASLFTACKKEGFVPVPPGNPGQPVVPKIQFASANYEVSEGFNDLEIEIRVNPKPAKPAAFTIRFDDQNTQNLRDYITIPGVEEGKITLTVGAGADKVSFRFKTANDDVHNDLPRQVKLTLEPAQGSALKPEGITSATVKILDDENHSMLGFEQPVINIYEQQQDGIEIKLLLEPAAKQAGYFDLSYTSSDAVHGQQFTTLPAFVQGRQRIWVEAGAPSVSFRLKPIDNYALNSHRTIRFTITGSSPHFTLNDKKELQFGILDNGASDRLTLKTIRDSYKGNNQYYMLPFSIRGRVTSINDNVPSRVAFIQDETGGIAVEFTGNNSLSIGELVAIRIDNAMLSEKNEVLTLSNVSNHGILRQGYEFYMVPDMTLEQLSQKPALLEGTLVTLKNVLIGTSSLGTTWKGDVDISDGPYTARVRTESFASFSDQPVPTGSRKSVTGILIWTQNGYVILPQSIQHIW
ncbi:MAG TPA: DUF5689 domain-containing protein [Phnomibacter sp.]|nr:DUF5689 domain-containing protein [Phnomibacter sp.]